MNTDHNPYQAPNTKLAYENTIVFHDNNYASRGDRLLAAILDGIIIAVLAGILLFLLKDTQIFKSFIYKSSLLLNTLITIGLSILLYVLLNGYLIYKSAQTLGKYFMGIQVVDLEGKPISGNRYLFKRLLPFLIVQNLPAAGGIIALINYLLIFRKDHNCLHDDIAKTRVVSLQYNNDDLPLIKTENNEDNIPNNPSKPSSEFKDYTFADLISALDAMNEDLYPDRALSLKKEINHRKEIKNFN